MRVETLRAMAVLIGVAAVFCAGATWRASTQDTTRRDPQFRLNVNTATPGQLQVLPRIGPKTARYIVADRQEQGAFRSIADLDRVRLIGPVTLERIGPWVAFDRPPADAGDDQNATSSVRATASSRR